MIFVPLALPGAYRIEPERREDARGFFARTWCAEEFGEQGLNPQLVQCSVSFNRLAGTLRGMHYQEAPYGEVKLVRCTRGSIYDVLVDLRPASPTLCQWVAEELTAENHRMLYIPEGLAHGFLTLEDATEVFYQMSTAFQPSAARGLRWNDPGLAIAWPQEPKILSDRDRTYADFQPPQRVSSPAS